MTQNRILDIINEEGLFGHNVFNAHSQKANEVIIKHENEQYVVYRTDECNEIIGSEMIFPHENEAIDYFIKQLHEVKNQYLSAIVGKKFDIYYKEKYEKRPLNKIFISWKWPPFFFGYGWLLYRKMYLETIIIFCFLIIAGIILSILNFDRYLRGIYDLTRLILALIGNSLYYSKINRVIKKLDHIEPKNHNQYLRKQGGTNIVTAIVVEILISGIFLLLIIL